MREIHREFFNNIKMTDMAAGKTLDLQCILDRFDSQMYKLI